MTDASDRELGIGQGGLRRVLTVAILSVSGTVACLGATEAIKLICGIGTIDQSPRLG